MDDEPVAISLFIRNAFQEVRDAARSCGVSLPTDIEFDLPLNTGLMVDTSLGAAAARIKVALNVSSRSAPEASGQERPGL